MEVVSVKKLKRPVGSGTWRAYVLADDELGIWLHTPAGSVYQGEDGQHRDVCEVAQDSNGAGRSIVQLIPPNAWWIATWYPPATELQISVDICTPATLQDQTWAYTDLELDPWRDADGTVGTDDWDEFQAARAAGRISAEEAIKAMEATHEVERLLRQRTEPFRSEGIAKLATAMELDLPPLGGESPS